MVSTPLSVKEILRGQWLALRRQFLGPLLAVIAVELIFLAASLQRESFQAQPINPVLWLAGIVMLVADVVALGWVGMWEAMTAKKPNHVTGKTIVRILVAPWVLYIAIAILIAFLLEDAPPPSPLNWHFFVGLWFGLGLLTDAAFSVGAALHLRRSFRTLALQRFAPAPSPLGRIFRFALETSRGSSVSLDSQENRHARAECHSFYAALAFGSSMETMCSTKGLNPPAGEAGSVQYSWLSCTTEGQREQACGRRCGPGRMTGPRVCLRGILFCAMCAIYGSIGRQ